MGGLGGIEYDLSIVYVIVAVTQHLAKCSRVSKHYKAKTTGPIGALVVHQQDLVHSAKLGEILSQGVWIPSMFQTDGMQ